MALRKDFTNRSGMTAAGAYHRVEGVTHISKTQIAFSLAVYNISPEANPYPAGSIGFTCPVDIFSEHDTYAQAYFYLKSLPDWANAVDVLED